MQHFQFQRFVLVSTLCLVFLLDLAPGVSARSLSVSSTSRVFQPSGCPSISGFTPSSGSVGTSVTITGCGFTGATKVSFNGVSTRFFIVNLDSQITARVPTGASTGYIVVTTPGGKAKSPRKFVVLAVLKLTPTVGPPTSTLSVFGFNFGHKETVNVYFDSTNVAQGSTDEQGQFWVSIQVPAGAVPGTHWVSGTGQHSHLGAQAPFLVQTDWPMFGYDLQHSHYNAYENVLNPANVSKLHTDWIAPTGKWIHSSPAVANGVVYVGSWDGNLYAFNAQTGTQVWKAPTGGSILSSPALANGVVYVGSWVNPNGNLYAFNAQTGALLWKAHTGSYISLSSPAVANGVVYIGSTDNNLYAFNAQTGVLRWKARTGNSIDSSPAVANGVVYVGSFYATLYAFNAQTGALLWQATTGGPIYSSPAVANGVVYVGSDDDNLYAFNAQTGALLWKATTRDKVDSSPAVANGVVYVGSDDHNLYAFNAQTGALLWKALMRDWVPSSPTVANGVVYIGSHDGILYAFNAQNGAQLWKASTGNYIFSSPTVANGVVYVGSWDYNLYAFALPHQDWPQAPKRPDPDRLL